MRMAVKYCGGCNVSYDRGAMVERLAEDFPDLEIVNADRNEAGSDPDLVLVICGCPSVCASHQHLTARRGKFLTAAEKDFEAVEKAIRELRKNGEDDGMHTCF